MSLLARGWGNTIQILAATRVVDVSGGSGAGAGGGSGGREGAGRGQRGALWPSLAVVKELSASAAVVAVEWLREQVKHDDVQCTNVCQYVHIYGCMCFLCPVSVLTGRSSYPDSAQVFAMPLVGRYLGGENQGEAGGTK